MVILITTIGEVSHILITTIGELSHGNLDDDNRGGISGNLDNDNSGGISW